MEEHGKDAGDCPRAQDAHEYLKKHQILDLFDNLTAQMIYERPGM